MFGKGKSCLTHAPDCPSVGKVKKWQLVDSAAFRSTVFAAKGKGAGKATKQQLETRTQELGFGGVTAKRDVMYDARKAVEASPVQRLW